MRALTISRRRVSIQVSIVLTRLAVSHHCAMSSVSHKTSCRPFTDCTSENRCFGKRVGIAHSSCLAAFDVVAHTYKIEMTILFRLCRSIHSFLFHFSFAASRTAIDPEFSFIVWLALADISLVRTKRAAPNTLSSHNEAYKLVCECLATILWNPKTRRKKNPFETIRQVLYSHFLCARSPHIGCTRKGYE